MLIVVLGTNLNVMQMPHFTFRSTQDFLFPFIHYKLIFLRLVFLMFFTEQGFVQKAYLVLTKGFIYKIHISYANSCFIQEFYGSFSTE